ncbi:MAG: SAVED domain-containing protein, partial [Sphingobacteriaceae bacterium]
SIWEITHINPGNDFLRSKELLGKFRSIMRKAFDQIKQVHGQNNLLHVFPAMPVSTAVELGRVRMPKADLPMIIYDQNNKHKAFISTINLD